jgi:hypothetical protein
MANWLDSKPADMVQTKGKYRGHRWSGLMIFGALDSIMSREAEVRMTGQFRLQWQL